MRPREDDAPLLALEARLLDRMHPADVERLLTISERNVLEVKAAIRRRSKLLVRRKPGVPGVGGVVGGRAKLSSRPASGASQRPRRDSRD